MDVAITQYTATQYAFSAGPWGGSAGKEWSYKPARRISKIMLFYKQAVHGIRFCSVHNGETVWSETFGEDEPRGDATMIYIRYPEEQLASIDGICGSLYNGGPRMITSLTLTTNLSRYGPFGRGVAGTRFYFDFKGGIVTGFHGRSDEYLYAIGVHMNTPHQEYGIHPSQMKKNAAIVSATENRDEKLKRKRQRKDVLEESVKIFEESMRKLVQSIKEKITAIGKPKLFIDLAVDDEESINSKPEIDSTLVDAAENVGNAAHLPQPLTTSSVSVHLSAFKDKIESIVHAGVDKFSSDDATIIETLSVELEEELMEVEKMKVKQAIGLMKEVERLEELRKKLEVQQVEYKQDYSRTDEYFEFLKKSIDIMAEVKNDEHLLRKHGLYKSNVSLPFEFFDSSMSVLVIKLQKKVLEIKRLEEHVDELITKKKLAFGLLKSSVNN